MHQVNSYGNPPAIPDTFVLEIEGKIVNSGKSPALTRVELLCDNRVIDSFIMKDQQRMFAFNLKKNNSYTIRISKDGYVSKLVCIDTRVPVFNENLYRFSFETKLIDNETSEKLNKEVLDMPIAMIYFDVKKGCFYYSKAYTSNIKRSLAMK
jgi:hypothetical protein